MPETTNKNLNSADFADAPLHARDTLAAIRDAIAAALQPELPSAPESAFDALEDFQMRERVANASTAALAAILDQKLRPVSSLDIDNVFDTIESHGRPLSELEQDPTYFRRAARRIVDIALPGMALAMVRCAQLGTALRTVLDSDDPEGTADGKMLPWNRRVLEDLLGTIEMEGLSESPLFEPAPAAQRMYPDIKAEPVTQQELTDFPNLRARLGFQPQPCQRISAANLPQEFQIHNPEEYARAFQAGMSAGLQTSFDEHWKEHSLPLLEGAKYWKGRCEQLELFQAEGLGTWPAPFGINYFRDCLGEGYTPAHLDKHQGRAPRQVREVMVELAGTKGADVIASLVDLAHTMSVQRQSIGLVDKAGK